MVFSVKVGRPGGAAEVVRAFICKTKGLQRKALIDMADALKKHPTFTDVILCFCFLSYYVLLTATEEDAMRGFFYTLALQVIDFGT